jgi:molybdopterin molybdotransferase
MIGLAEAQARLLALIPETAGPRVVATPLAESAGRILMADVMAARTQPVRDLSAMDGYAVAGAGPWTLVGESAAGRAWSGQMSPGQAVRIFTGAVVPDGTQSVVMQENVVRTEENVALAEGAEARPGQHIRLRGSDFSEGQTLLTRGQMMTPPCIALAASAGHGTVMLTRPVSVAILSTGDELVPPGLLCAEDQIPSSNGLMLSALFARPGVTIVDLGIVPDRRDALAAAIDRAKGCDILVTIGGASVGDHDLVRPALIAAGAEIDFWKVAIKPGKPLMAGRLGDGIVVGLPGNPVSAYVTAILFAVPLINAFRGMDAPLPQTRIVPCAAALPATGNRTDHIRAYMVDGRAKPVGINDSAALRALSAAECLIVRQPGAPPVAEDEPVDVLVLT